MLNNPASPEPAPATDASPNLSESFFPSLRSLAIAGAAALPLIGLAGYADIPAPDVNPPAASQSFDQKPPAEHSDNTGGITILHNGKPGIDLGGGLGIGFDGKVGISLF